MNGPGDYVIVAVTPEQELMRVRCYQYGEQLWARAKLPNHKQKKCASCGVVILPRGDHLWRPITNRGNRLDRICHPCVLQFLHGLNGPAGRET